MTARGAHEPTLPARDRHADLRRRLLLGGGILMIAAAAIVVVTQWQQIAFALGLKSTTDPYAPAQAATTATGKSTVPGANRLVVPRIGLNVRVVEGKGVWALKRGVWHQPNGAAPYRAGNTVISGHRVNSAFVLIDQLRRGDTIVVYWRKHRYSYRVVRVYETGPNDRRVTRCGRAHRLTLYTCVARVEGDRRVVVVAVPK
jgi:LPXTG-site transpeptidase (sortase) family protein